MTKQDIIRKLSSRKFWVALCALVSAILIFCNVQEGSIQQITTIIMAFGTMMAYLFTEGAADVASIQAGYSQPQQTQTEAEQK